MRNTTQFTYWTRSRCSTRTKTGLGHEPDMRLIRAAPGGLLFPEQVIRFSGGLEAEDCVFQLSDGCRELDRAFS